MDSEVVKKINEAMSGLSATMSNIDGILDKVNAKFLDGAKLLGDGAKRVSQETEAMGGSAEKAADQQKKLGEAVQGTTKASSSYLETVKGVLGQNRSLVDNAELAGTAISFLSLKIMGASRVMRDWKTANTLGNKSARGTADSIQAVIEAAQKLSFLGPKIAKALEPFKEGAEQIAYAREDENNLTALRARHGGFSGKDKGQSADRVSFVGGLDQEMTRFKSTNTAVANSVNLASTEVSGYVAEIMKLPRLYDQTIKLGAGEDQTMTSLEAAIRLARGTTGNFADSMSALTFQFRNFGKYDGAEQLLARTYKLSQQLGVGFADLEKPIINISRRFAMFGDNTRSVINLTGGLTKALMNTGMGIEPATVIVEKMVGGIADLNVAQRAFMSAQTGGSGGLRGAFEIEKLMRDGNMDEVYKKMQDTLMKQFGGRIVTLEEASQDDASAATRMRQQAMLTQGPFGDIVGGEKGASRLLDAMAGGNLTDFTRDTTGGAVDEAMKVDDATQKRQLNQLHEIANNTRLLADVGVIAVAAEARKTLGGGNLAVAGRQKRVKSDERGRAKNLQAGDVPYRGPELEATAALDRVGQSAQGILKASGPGLKKRLGISDAQSESAENAAKKPGLRDAQSAAAAAAAGRRPPVAGVPEGATGAVEPTVPGAPGVAGAGTSISLTPSEIKIILQNPEGKVLGQARLNASIANGGQTPSTIFGVGE